MIRQFAEAMRLVGMAIEANQDWVEADDRESSVADIFPDAPRMEWGRSVREYTDNDRLVAAGILAGKTDAKIARDTGIEYHAVARIRRRFMS